MGCLTNRFSTTNFRDRASVDVEKPLRVESKERDIMTDGRRGRLRESFYGEFSNIFSEDHMNNLGLIVNTDDHHTLFSLDELEENFDVLANHRKPEPTIGSPSAYFDHLGLDYCLSSPSSSARLNTHASTDPSAPFASTIPSVSWLKTHAPTDPGAVKFTNAGPSLRENSGNTTREADLAGSASVTRYDHWIGKNEIIVARPFSQPVVARRKTGPKTKTKRKTKIKAKSSVSSTRHKHWTKEEDETLRNAMAQEGKGKIYWNQISRYYFRTTRSAAQCKNRWKNVSLSYFCLPYRVASVASNTRKSLHLYLLFIFTYS